jgi:hypothetical protein
MTTRNRQPTLKNKLASTLLTLWAIPHEHAKQMTDDQVISLFEFDHWPIPYAEGGETIGSNLLPMFIGNHRIKTRFTDVPGIAKRKRVRRAHEDFVRLIATPRDERPPKKRSIASRGFDKRKRKFNNRKRAHP